MVNKPKLELNDLIIITGIGESTNHHHFKDIKVNKIYKIMTKQDFYGDVDYSIIDEVGAKHYITSYDYKLANTTASKILYK